jgi:glycosyl transferase family 25
MALSDLFWNAKRFATTVRRKRFQPLSARRQPMPIIVINLERNVPRRKFILRHLLEQGFEASVFKAVDGRELDLAELERTGIYNEALSIEKFSRRLSLAEIGCAMSHLGVYAQVLHGSADMVLVLEDDAMLVPNFEASLQEVLAGLPSDWDVVQLIYECNDFEPVAPRVVRFLMQRSMPVAAAGYLLRKSGAQKLLDGGYPIHYPADSLIGRSPRWGTKVFGATPQIVEINNVFPSAIQRDQNLRARVATAAKEMLVRLLG